MFYLIPVGFIMLILGAVVFFKNIKEFEPPDEPSKEYKKKISESHLPKNDGGYYSSYGRRPL